MALLFSRTSSGSVINLLFTYNRNMPSMDILAYPIDLVANTVNSIKEDKLLKEQNFAFLYELQHFKRVWFGLFARSSDSHANRLFTTLCLQMRRKKKRAKGSRSTCGGWGSGFVINDGIKIQENRGLWILRPKVIIVFSDDTLFTLLSLIELQIS